MLALFLLCPGMVFPALIVAAVMGSNVLSILGVTAVAALLGWGLAKWGHRSPLHGAIYGGLAALICVIVYISYAVFNYHW